MKPLLKFKGSCFKRASLSKKIHRNLTGKGNNAQTRNTRDGLKPKGSRDSVKGLNDPADNKKGGKENGIYYSAQHRSAVGL